jgi:hypothetical protein
MPMINAVADDNLEDLVMGATSLLGVTLKIGPVRSYDDIRNKYTARISGRDLYYVIELANEKGTWAVISLATVEPSLSFSVRSTIPELREMYAIIASYIAERSKSFQEVYFDDEPGNIFLERAMQN